jgi:hypothetical protein
VANSEQIILIRLDCFETNFDSEFDYVLNAIH